MIKPNDYSNIIIDPKRPVVFLDLCGTFANTSLTHDILDMYGVLDPYVKSNIALRNSTTHDALFKPFWEHTREIFTLNRVQVIIVSSWVNSYLPKSSEQIVELSKFLGYENIVGSLNTNGGVARGHHVEAFVRKHDIKTWMVIDDSRVEMYHNTKFFTNNRFIHPHGRWGIGAKEIEKIKYLLSNYNDPWLNKAYDLEVSPGLYIDPKEGN